MPTRQGVRASLTPKTATFKVSGVQAELPQNTQRYGKKRQAVVVTIVESAQLGSILVHPRIVCYDNLLTTPAYVDSFLNVCGIHVE